MPPLNKVRGHLAAVRTVRGHANTSNIADMQLFAPAARASCPALRVRKHIARYVRGLKTPHPEGAGRPRTISDGACADRIITPQSLRAYRDVAGRVSIAPPLSARIHNLFDVYGQAALDLGAGAGHPFF